jgi:RNA polymerase sigma factor (sigma-70 family)
MKAKAPGRFASSASLAFVEYQKDLHRFLVRRLKDAEDAADLAQEVYLRLLRIENSELVRSPRDYLYGIAAHVVHQFRMRTRRELVTYDSDAVDEIAEHPPQLDALDELPDRLNLQRELERALAQLSPTHQAVFLLRKRDGFSLQEIATQLGLSAHTVKKYLFQAKAQIRTQWDGAKE